MKYPANTFTFGEQLPALTFPRIHAITGPEETAGAGTGDLDLPPDAEDEDSDDMRPATEAIEL
ncbi:MAG: hypothetical protein ACOYM3_02805 [Terrimicrobiaceae bacterium]